MSYATSIERKWELQKRAQQLEHRAETTVPVDEHAKALRRFHWDCAWTGVVESGDDPLRSRLTRGHSHYRWVAGGAWLIGEVEREEQQDDGSWKPAWSALYLVGWDKPTQQYLATIVDSAGTEVQLRGTIHDDRLVLESTGEGAVRITFDVTNPGSPFWLRERRFDGHAYQRAEERQLCAGP